MLPPTVALDGSQVLQRISGPTEAIDLASGQSDRSLHVAIELIGEVTAQDYHILLVSFRTLGEFFVGLADLKVGGGACH